MNEEGLKIIFLDIDGVLNSEVSVDYHIKNKSNEWLYYAPWYGHVKHVNHIIKHTGAKVVISSTWRHFYDVRMILHLAGLVGDIIGKTPCCKSRIRGEEIKLFLQYVQMDDAKIEPEKREALLNIKKELLYYHRINYSGLKIDNFVIIDDDTDMLDLTNNFVHVDSYYGLTRKNANKAIKILNGDK